MTLLAVFTALSSARSWAEEVTSFIGQVDLPLDMVTREGTLLKKGRFELEVCLEQERSTLLFKDGGQIVATLSGQPPPRQGTRPATVPLAGTLYMLPVDPGSEKDPYGRGTSRDNWFKVERPWKASLRIYKLSGKEDGAVFFIFQQQVGPEQWFRADFQLRLSNPPS